MGKQGFDVQTATIANAATDSSTFSTVGYEKVGLFMPAAFTGATITFKVGNGAGTFNQLYDKANAAVSVTVAASRNYDLPTEVAGWPEVKIVSASAEGAARTLVIFKRT